MKGVREVFTAEELYEELRPRLERSDAWLAQSHPNLVRAAEAMVEALQKKEAYGGGVVQRAAHLAAHLKATDPVLAEWMDHRWAAEAAANAAAGGGATPSVKGSGASGPKLGSREGADGDVEAEAASAEAAASGGAAGAAAAAGEEGEAKEGRRKGARRVVSKGDAQTALEYLCTTFAHLREQRTLVMGDRKDKLLREITLLRQLRGGEVNVLRGGKAHETSMGQMLAALKAADQPGAVAPRRKRGEAAQEAEPQPPQAQEEGKAEQEAVKEAAKEAGKEGAKEGAEAQPTSPKAAAGAAKGGQVAGKKPAGPQPRDGLDNLTCVVWEDWRIPERLDTLLRAGDSLTVYVEVHCRDGPEDTRLAMRMSTFVSLALCSQRLIAELYHDMFITPQRVAAARPQRKRPRTAMEEVASSLDECVHSLDYVDFVEALHRRMPLRCGWMYANAIMPSADEWNRIFGPTAGRLSGLFEGGAELDALGRSVLSIHNNRHESPLLDLHALASTLRSQQQAGAQHAQQPAEACRPSPPRMCTGKCGASPATADKAGAADVPAPSGSSCRQPSPPASCAAAICTCEPAAPASAAAAATATASSAPSLLIRQAGDSGFTPDRPSGGVDLGHVSFTCVTTASLSDDFLGELIRQSTHGPAAAKVAEAAAASAAKLAVKREALAARSGSAAATPPPPPSPSASTELPVAPRPPPPVPTAALLAAEAAEEEDEVLASIKEELACVAEVSEAAELEGKILQAEADRRSGYVPPKFPEVKPEVKAEAKPQLKSEPAAKAPAAAVKAEPAGAGLGVGVAAEGGKAEFRPAAEVMGCSRGLHSHQLQLMPGVFFSYFIGSQAFTNTTWHVEDFLLQSINLMCVGRPKAWYWVPRHVEPAFLEYLDEHWENEDVYTKSVPLAGIALEKLIKMGVRRSVQLPGAIFLTSPGYAFHTTMSSGWSMADSANFMVNFMDKTMHILEEQRPLEQYPHEGPEALTNTGEWVRYSMRRIELLRSLNDPSYAPKTMGRYQRAIVERRDKAYKKALEEAEDREREAEEAREKAEEKAREEAAARAKAESRQRSKERAKAEAEARARADAEARAKGLVAGAAAPGAAAAAKPAPAVAAAAAKVFAAAPAAAAPKAAAPAAAAKGAAAPKAAAPSPATAPATALPIVKRLDEVEAKVGIVQGAAVAAAPLLPSQLLKQLAQAKALKANAAAAKRQAPAAAPAAGPAAVAAAPAAAAPATAAAAAAIPTAKVVEVVDLVDDDVDDVPMHLLAARPQLALRPLGGHTASITITAAAAGGAAGGALSAADRFLELQAEQMLADGDVAAAVLAAKRIKTQHQQQQHQLLSYQPPTAAHGHGQLHQQQQQLQPRGSPTQKRSFADMAAAVADQMAAAQGLQPPAQVRRLAPVGSAPAALPPHTGSMPQRQGYSLSSQLSSQAQGQTQSGVQLMYTGGGGDLRAAAQLRTARSASDGDGHLVRMVPHSLLASQQQHASHAQHDALRLRAYSESGPLRLPSHAHPHSHMGGGSHGSQHDALLQRPASLSLSAGAGAGSLRLQGGTTMQLLSYNPQHSQHAPQHLGSQHADRLQLLSRGSSGGGAGAGAGYGGGSGGLGLGLSSGMGLGMDSGLGLGLDSGMGMGMGMGRQSQSLGMSQYSQHL
ncbi:hypothetical protein HYH03_013162 [Edaphochlamys debaryana]|uniref:JmjC domain-containing protein n=1 Tax=Edaphochlamys debaryana TaxID=47281 RepID=A0A835XNS2_9CHLO|nr:hypothetical protein HYH03_013162 [Edaphochlamys debaryana]|eukprot:KAG2488312.1 hypothetical protein HYH03_013162 [Edaphochlamys debaryana]